MDGANCGAMDVCGVARCMCGVRSTCHSGSVIISLHRTSLLPLDKSSCSFFAFMKMSLSENTKRSGSMAPTLVLICNHLTSVAFAATRFCSVV